MFHLSLAIISPSLLLFYQDMLVPNFHPQPTVTSTVQGTQWVHSMPSSTYMYPVCITAVQWSYKKYMSGEEGKAEQLREEGACMYVVCVSEPFRTLWAEVPVGFKIVLPRFKFLSSKTFSSPFFLLQVDPSKSVVHSHSKPSPIYPWRQIHVEWSRVLL